MEPRQETEHRPTDGRNGLGDELRAREAELELIFSQLPALVWTTGRDLRIDRVSGPLLRTLRLARKPEGARLDEVVRHQPHAAQLLRDNQRLALEGETRRFQLRVEERTYDVTLAPLRVDHHIQGCVGCAVEVTSWVAREKRLEEHERLLSQAQRIAHVGSWDWDVRTDRLHWSAELCRIYGIEPRNFGGNSAAFFTRLHPEDREVTLAALREAFTHGTEYACEHRIVRDDGEVRKLLTRAAVERDHGKPRRVVGICFDITERWKADERNARSLSLLRATVEATHDGILVVDGEGKIALRNKRLEEVWGIPIGEGVYLDDEKAIALAMPLLKDPDGFLSRIHELYAHPDSESHDVLRFKDGRVLERFSQPQRLGDEVVGRVWSFHDVTEQRRASAQEARSRSLLLAVVESVHDGLLVVDMHGVTTFYNDRFAQMWRIPASPTPLPRAELMAIAAPQLEDPDAFRSRANELYGRPPEESHDVLRLKDGRIFERFSRPQRVGDEFVGRVWTFRDVTERERLLERALFLSDSSRLLASLDAEQAAIAVGKRALPLLGDVCTLDLIPEDAAPRRLFTHSLEGPVTVGDPSVFALAGNLGLTTRDGRAWMAVPLRSRDAILGVLTFRAHPDRPFDRSDLELAGDLAQRMALSFENARLYRQAGEALKVRDEFLSVAAHELRGPATALKLVLHGLAGAVEAPQRARMLELADRQVRHVARFVDELLDVTRVRGQRMHLDLEEIDLAAVAREVASRMGDEVTHSGSALTLRADRPVVGRWDRLRLEQLASNLLGNALKFGRGRPVTVDVRREGASAVLAISDQGIGIPPSQQARIFEAFERAASPRHYGGLGLGLYISRSIAEALHGTLEVESAPDRGSTFTARLPAANGEEAVG